MLKFDGYSACELHIRFCFKGRSLNVGESNRAMSDQYISKPESEDEIQEAVDWLERIGLLHKVGEYREGQPVYAPTLFSRALSEMYPIESDFWEAVEMLERQLRN